MIPGNANPLLLSSAAAVPGPGYQVPRSVRMRRAGSANAQRTPSVTGDPRKFTFSTWVKRGQLGLTQSLLSANIIGGLNHMVQITFSATDQLDVYLQYLNTGKAGWPTVAVFRDVSAWYHIVVAVDTTQVGAAQCNIWVNGVLQPTVYATYSTSGFPQNANTNVNVASQAMFLGWDNYVVSAYLDGYWADTYVIDGQALTPASFGQTDSVWGTWTAKAYTGSYGTNGCYLPYNNTASTTTLFADASGNGNNWTPASISLTSGASYDSMYDVPLGAGGSVGNGLGNYATLCTLVAGATGITDGNLKVSNSYGVATATFGWTDKGYMEAVWTAIGATEAWLAVGSTDIVAYSSTGQKYINGTPSAYGASWTTSDNIAVSIDCVAGSATYYKNGVSQGAITGRNFAKGVTVTTTGGNIAGTNTVSVNFGQRPFAYTPPTGYLALHTGNLPTPTIQKPNQYFDAVTYTGTGATQSVTNPGGFQPDLVWTHDRSATANSMRIVDSKQGSNNLMYPDLSTTMLVNVPNSIALSSNGITLGTAADANTLAKPYVAWMWKAGAVPGFYVTSYVGNGATAVVTPHPLGKVPVFIMVKNISTAVGYGWFLHNENINVSAPASQWSAVLDATSGPATTAPSPMLTATSSNITTAYSSLLINAGNTHEVWMWAPIEGFSSMGVYRGNASVDGPFVYCGFRPKFIFVMNWTLGTTATGGGWRMFYDTARSPNNANTLSVINAAAAAEGTYPYPIDFLSIGFKVRDAGTQVNQSTAYIVYMAFAENPFKYALAR